MTWFTCSISKTIIQKPRVSWGASPGFGSVKNFLPKWLFNVNYKNIESIIEYFIHSLIIQNFACFANNNSME